MGSLIRFELRKILNNRAGMVACALALVMLVGITVLDVFTTETYDQSGRTCAGLEALDAYRARQESHAGNLDAARVAADLTIYDRAYELAKSEEPAYSSMSSEQVLDVYGFEFWRDTYAVLQDTYFRRLHQVMLTSDETYAKDLGQGMAARANLDLDHGFRGRYSYSPSERALWQEKLAGIESPLEWGYADGWVSAFNWTTFLGFAVAALCVALSGVFSSEYQNRTDSIVLPTKLGKSALPLAKVVASLIFTTVYWWIVVAAMMGGIFAFFGTEGAGLPVQVSGFTNLYPLTIGKATLLRCVLGYVVALGMAALTLLLSSKVRSAVVPAIVPVSLMLLGLVGIFFNPTAKLAGLLPLGGMTWSYMQTVSYAVGPLALDLPKVLLLLYGAMLLALTPLAMRAFTRHQVA